jgi:hypothetical protein
MRPFDYIIAVGSSRAVLQCSDGKPEESVTCQRLIGWSIAKNYLREGAQLAWDATDEKRLYDNRIAQYSDQFEYYALVTNHRKDKDPVKRIVLGNAAQLTEATASYKALFAGGAAAEYTVGVFLNTKTGQPTRNMVTRFKGVKANYDCYELLAKYAQTDLKSYAEEAADEKAAKLKTQTEFNDYLKEQNTKLRGLYGGEGEALARKHRFIAIGYNKKSMALRTLAQGDYNNMK